MNTRHDTIKTTCAYCGVGCGIEATIDDVESHKVTIKGDPSHPSNFGKLCSKGAALGETVSLEGRLLHPQINGKQCDWDTALDAVAKGFSDIINEHGSDAIAFYVSGQLATEDYYVANKLMKGYIGSANIDTNSRLCMSSPVAAYKRAFGSDIVPCCYEDLEQAELIILEGSNAAWCHPILFQRIRAAKEKNPALKVVVIDPRVTATCDIADLHLAIKPGTDASLFNGLLAYLAQNNALNHSFIDLYTEGFKATLELAQKTATDIETVAKKCGLSEQQVQKFYDDFIAYKQVITAYSQGVNQSSSGTDKCNAIINCHLASGKIGQPGMGPFSLTGQPNAMGGREVGGLANMLAAHMELDNPVHVDLLSRFWESDKIATKQGFKAVDMFDAVDQGKIKAIWIMATNPVVSMPNADKIKKALSRCDLVVVSDCIEHTDTSAFAHIKLPAVGWSEKNGTFTNIERRISRQRALFQPSGEAKEDWWIIAQVAKRMGFEKPFSFQTSADVFREFATLTGFENDQQHTLRDLNLSAFNSITQQQYDNLQPIQWPVTVNNPGGTERMLQDNLFFTPNRKARFIAITPRTAVNKISKQYPLVLNTGRIRDQWHTMTRTALSPRLNNHYPEPFVEIFPSDAEQFGLEDQSLATIESQWGKMLARVNVTQNQQPGSLFIPMHWSNQLSKQGRVGALVNPEVDPVSGQPESKQTPVRIKPYQAKLYGMILSRTPRLCDEFDYAIKVKGDQYYRYEIAKQSVPENETQWKRALLGEVPKDWIEFIDEKAGFYRAAHFLEGELQACIFLSPIWKLPDPGWIATLFKKQQLSRIERLSLLSGHPPKGQEDIGRIICSCFNVGEKMIVKAIKEQNLNSVEQIGACLNAGTGCGSCLSELKGFIKIPEEKLSTDAIEAV